MKIQFKRTPEQVELVKALASKNPAEREKAQYMFAALVGPELSKVYLQEDTTQFIFKQQLFPDDNDLSFPLDEFRDIGRDHYTIWTTQQPGSVMTNEIAPGIDEVKFTVTTLESAFSMNQKYAEKARLDVVAHALTRMLQEFLLKTNYMSWQVLLKFLAEAIDTRNGNIGQVYASRTAGVFNMDDYNSLQTRFRRLNASWVGGTPVGGASKPTDFILSPEMMEMFRKMSYNPINTQGGGNTAITANSQQSAGVGIALPDTERAALYNTAGVPTFYGIQLMELLELGKSQDYQSIFADYIGSTTLPYIGVSGSTETFSASADELIIVLDSTKEFGFAPIVAGQDYGSAITMEPDDQFLKRAKKFGYFSGLQTSRVCVESRGVVGMVV